MSAAGSSIPASDIVNIVPAVLNAGGDGLDTIGFIITSSTRLPVGSYPSYGNAPSVADYFGDLSDEAKAASIYFNGFDNSDVKPNALIMGRYLLVRASAWIRGAPNTLTLAQLNLITTGQITITIDGFVYTTPGNIDLSVATSFSNAASIIQTALLAVAPPTASFTGVMTTPPSGIPTLTASAVTGTISPGTSLNGASVPAGCTIVAQLTGTPGGAGTYQVSVGATITSEAMTTTSTGPNVSYDSVSSAFMITSALNGSGSTMGYGTGSLATALNFTQALGATLSQGAKKSDPISFMDGVVAVTQNWVGFTTLFNPDTDGTPTQKLLFAQWTNAQGDQYAYVPWDPDSAPTVSNDATTSLGWQIENVYEYDGTAPVWGPDYSKAVFALGTGASIAWDETEGRITFKFKSQSGLAADVTDLQTADNLRANGYNFYGAWATRAQQFQGFADGTVSGKFTWLDSYYDQIWLNNAFQLALMELLFAVKSIPYTQKGYSLMDAALADPINAGLNNGVIRAGVTLSAAQTAEINNAAGNTTAAQTVTTQGWYLQIVDASPQVRAQRGSPPARFWYTDGESVHFINLTSITVQ